MQQASLPLRPDAGPTKPGLDARTLWRASYRQSRSMIRAGGRYGLGSRYAWALCALRDRFGASGWPVCQQAARLAFDRAAVSKAATGTLDALSREGMLTRAVRVEPAPRGLGWCWAFTFDDLASPNTARSLRRLAAQRLRQERAARLQVNRGLAADRVAIQAGPFFTLTELGRASLAASRVNLDAEVSP